ncbi:MAG TPA: dTDP-4-dehydrorhamnose 3,5-epimerase family protein [Bryobacteraceae bacterium]|nr:dTDP-4-dehydrorhamnose 3,5-epimerase family protein [Bryobacteraceae bacterium]
MIATSPRKDKQTVTVDGQPVTRLIEGVIIKSAVTHIDDRGTLCEIHTPHSAPLEKPVVYVYQFTIRPGKIKGWHVHHHHDDRIFISQGHVKVVLYDSREQSPTYGMVNEIYRTDLDRNLMVIPAFVYHAHQNIGTTDALFISMPTRAYQHDDPDVFRYPVDSEEIPYKFDNRQGW